MPYSNNSEGPWGNGGKNNNDKKSPWGSSDDDKPGKSNNDPIGSVPEIDEIVRNRTYDQSQNKTRWLLC